MLKKPFLKSLHLNMVMQGSLVSKEYLVCGMGAVSDLLLHHVVLVYCADNGRAPLDPW